MSGYHTRLTWCKKQHCLSKLLNVKLKRWLFDTGSLTSRLIEHCNGDFSVKIIAIRRATPRPDEISALNMRPRSHALIREVHLCCDNEPLVYARTIIPVSSLRGSLRGLALLGSKPLGVVLFSDKLMRRTPIEITSLKPGHKRYAWTENIDSKVVWGRRSVFNLKQQELLVSEFFLPALLE